jgi:hypothetical protein
VSILTGLAVAILIMALIASLIAAVLYFMGRQPDPSAEIEHIVKASVQEGGNERSPMAVMDDLRAAHAAVVERIGVEGQRKAEGRRTEPSREAGTQSRAGFEAISLRDTVELIKKAHHVAILCGTGDGKTWFGEACLRLLSNEEQFCVIDPNWTPSKWVGVPVVTTDEHDGFAPILKALQGIQAEARRRKLSTWNKEDIGPTLNIFWDEVNETMEEVTTAGNYLRRWLRRVRYLNMKLWIFPQSERVGALGLDGHGDAKKNLLWFYLGSDAVAKVQWLSSKGRASAEMVRWTMEQEWPCVVEFQGGFYAVDRSEVPTLVAQDIPSVSSRAWVPTGATTKQDLSDDLDLGVSAEDLELIELKSRGDQGVPVNKAITEEVKAKIAVIKGMDWIPLASLVASKQMTQEGLILSMFQVKPGASPVYAAARDALQDAMSRLQINEEVQK